MYVCILHVQTALGLIERAWHWHSEPWGMEVQSQLVSNMTKAGVLYQSTAKLPIAISQI